MFFDACREAWHRAVKKEEAERREDIKEQADGEGTNEFDFQGWL